MDFTKSGWSQRTGATFLEVSQMARVWALAIDPDGVMPNDELALRQRGITLGTLRNGTVVLHGELLPEVAAMLSRVLDVCLNPRVDGPPAPANRPGLDDQHRTPAQRRHDAFAALVSKAAALGDFSKTSSATATLVVTVTPEELQALNGVAFIDGVAPEKSIVNSRVARQIACNGAVQRVIMGVDGRIVELGSPHRLFNTHQRKAIATRDGGCIIPGCDVPSTWCEYHHVTEHAQGGPTHTDNGVLVCWFHHRTLDDATWQIQMRDGQPWVRGAGYRDPNHGWVKARGSPHRQFAGKRRELRQVDKPA